MSKHKLFGEIGSNRGENQKNNANIYADYEELRQQHIAAYRAGKKDKTQVTDALQKLPQTGLPTDQQKQVDLDAHYKSVFDESDSEMISINEPDYSDWNETDGLNFDEAEEDDWNG